MCASRVSATFPQSVRRPRAGNGRGCRQSRYAALALARIPAYVKGRLGILGTHGAEGARGVRSLLRSEDSGGTIGHEASLECLSQNATISYSCPDRFSFADLPQESPESLADPHHPGRTPHPEKRCLRLPVTNSAHMHGLTLPLAAFDWDGARTGLTHLSQQHPILPSAALSSEKSQLRPPRQ